MSKWTDEKVSLLKDLWAKGMSADLIANRMGSGLTRCAVLGKVNRLGLSNRATTQRSKAKSCRRGAKQAKANGKGWQSPAKAKPLGGTNGAPRLQYGKPAAVRALDAEPLPATEELIIPLEERKTIQTLTECSCRWPIGDPQAAEFHFCGKNKVTGLPYCEFHARRAYQPVQPRRPRSVDPTVPRLRAPQREQEDVI